MRYLITGWAASPKGSDTTLIASFETKEDAFEQAKTMWDNHMTAMTIEEIPSSRWPKRWRLRWPIGREVQITRVANDRCDIGYHLVAPLINGDVSGLEANEEHQLEQFISQYPDCVFEPDEDENGHIQQSFVRCEVTQKRNMCVTIKVFAR